MGLKIRSETSSRIEAELKFDWDVLVFQLVGTNLPVVS